MLSTAIYNMVWGFTEIYMASAGLRSAISRKSCLSAAWYRRQQSEAVFSGILMTTVLTSFFWLS